MYEWEGGRCGSAGEEFLRVEEGAHAGLDGAGVGEGGFEGGGDVGEAVDWWR